MSANLERQARLFKDYLIGEDGFIYSLHFWRGTRTRKIAFTHDNYGYCRVRLSIDGKRKAYQVHKLIAAQWLPKRPSLHHQLRHLDGNKEHNQASNLVWGTAQDNANDREKHGRTAKGSRNGSAKLTEKDVRKIKRLLFFGKPTATIASLFSITRENVNLIRSGKAWRHV